MIKKSGIYGGVVAGAVLSLSMGFAQAQTVKVGLIVSLTGPQATIGREVEAAARLYIAQNGDTVAGRKIELVVRDDTSNADAGKRAAQEMIVNDKVSVLAGFTLTPVALAVAPLASQAKLPAVIMAAGTASLVESSPWFVRSSMTLPQVTAPLAEWSQANGIKSVVSLVSDFGPGTDAEKAFSDRFTSVGGKVLSQLRVPLANPEFAAYLQRAMDLKPDAMFVFVPAGQGAALMKQVKERGLVQAGIKIIATGDVLDDEQLNNMGDDILGVISTGNYSTSHVSPENQAFVAAFTKANPTTRPNFMAVGGYDGMGLIYRALEKTGGDLNGAKLLDAMRNQSWQSARGPVAIDPETRDVVQNIYVRRVERTNGQLYNTEFATIPNVKDPTHTPR